MAPTCLGAAAAAAMTVSGHGTAEYAGRAYAIIRYQVVNCEDFHGQGETEPNPYFFQAKPIQCSAALRVVQRCSRSSTLCLLACSLTVANPFSFLPCLVAKIRTGASGWHPPCD
jgi:hypothetical protein